MNRIFRYSPSYLVIAASLSLLLLLIFLWIGKLYKDETEKMKESAISTLRIISNDFEQEIFDIHIKPNRKEYFHDSVIVYVSQLEQYVSQDKLVLMLNNGTIEAYKDSIAIVKKTSDDQHNMRKEIYRELDKNSNVLGSFHWSSINNVDSVFFDSVAIYKVNPLFIEKFQSAYQTSDARIYKMVDQNDTINVDGLIVAKLLTIPSLNHYAFIVPQYRYVIINRLLPQILFSTVVFISTGLVFGLMLINVKRIRELSAMKSDFVSNMTHELKTPIATVMVALEALTNFNAMQDKAKSEEYIDVSKKELNRLSILVDKVLKMSLFDENETTPQKETLDMKSLTVEITESMKLLFERAKGTYDLTFEGDVFLVKGDKIDLTNVIYNLIENAIKYSNQSPRVNILLKEEETKILIQVTDNGKGIDRQYQKKVFDKFFRVPAVGDRHQVKGYGLGLAYVSRVLKSHQGMIDIESELGIGSTFLITLPKA